MKPIASFDSHPELKKIAAKLFWWQGPETALPNPTRFFAQLMTFGTWNEVQTVKAATGWDAFQEALQVAPPGIFDERSWNYWHGFFGLPVPGMPQRSLT